MQAQCKYTAYGKHMTGIQQAGGKYTAHGNHTASIWQAQCTRQVNGLQEEIKPVVLSSTAGEGG